MFDKMKQLMEMKQQADRLKKELDALYVESQDVKGIKIVINGSQNVKSVELDFPFLNPEDKGRLEKDLARSVNAAIVKSQHLVAQKMKHMLPGGFPGL